MCTIEISQASSSSRSLRSPVYSPDVRTLGCLPALWARNMVARGGLSFADTYSHRSRRDEREGSGIKWPRLVLVLVLTLQMLQQVVAVPCFEPFQCCSCTTKNYLEVYQLNSPGNCTIPGGLLSKCALQNVELK